MGLLAKLVSIAILLGIVSAVQLASADTVDSVPPISITTYTGDPIAIRDLNEEFRGDAEIGCRIERATGSRFFRRVCLPASQADTERAATLRYLTGGARYAEYSRVAGTGTRGIGQGPPASGSGGGGFCQAE